eukprot:jgi/Picsp_1/3620/NSC_06457-R1_galactokinase like protein
MDYEKFHVAVYCSAHGLGHLTRCVEVSRLLAERGHSVTIVTKMSNCELVGGCSASKTLQDGKVVHRIRDLVADAGACQRNAFSVDSKKTLESYLQFHNNREKLWEQERDWMVANCVDVVISDIVPCAFQAAKMANIPSICLSNFTWDFIYKSFDEMSCGNASNSYQEMVKELESDYAAGSLYLRLPGACPCGPNLEPLAMNIPIISRKCRSSSAEVRKSLGISSSSKVCLVMLGGHQLGIGDFDIRQTCLPDGWVCLLTPSTLLDANCNIRDSKFKVINNLAYMPDVINCANVVVGKIGFGTVGECLSCKTPLVYVTRENFAEEKYLRDLLHECGAGMEISLDMFVSGNWFDFLERASKLEVKEISTSGAQVASEIIQELATLHKQAAKGHVFPEKLALQQECLIGWNVFLRNVLTCLERNHGLLQNTMLSLIFNRSEKIYVSRAPGRLDVLGGIADYSGSHALEMPIGQGTYVATQLQAHDSAGHEIRVDIFSPSQDSNSRSCSSSFLLSDIIDRQANGSCRSRSFDSVRSFFKRNSSEAWAAYVAGAFAVLSETKSIRIPESVGKIKILLSSQIGEGAGVSSSAAVEVASIVSIGSALGLTFEGHEVSILAHKVENFIVGACCGIMDQLSCYLGEPFALLSLQCTEPARIHGCIKIPQNIKLWGIDSGVKHSVGSSIYTSVRVGSFMGLKIIKVHQECISQDGQIACLTDLDPLEYEANFKDILPESMLGVEFISKYGSHDDPATSIDPALSYSIATPTGHPVYENYRVKRITDLMKNSKGDFSQEKAIIFGNYMYESHKSYSNCGLGSSETDTLVRLAMAEGASHGVFGAKITGGGCGGTVCILTSNDSNATVAVHRIASQYQKETGLNARILDGSSPGSQIFGTKILTVI